MSVAKLRVHFADHISRDRINSMVSGIAAYGNVLPDGAPQDFVVEVFRASKLPRLEAWLEQLERLGTIRWSEGP